MAKPRLLLLVALLFVVAFILLAVSAVWESPLPQAKVPPPESTGILEAEGRLVPVAPGSESGPKDPVLREVPTLRVTVVDEGRSPLAQCMVRVAGDECWRFGATDARGEAFFDVPSDPISALLIQATASGYEDGFLTIPPGCMSAIVQLRAGGRTLHGRMVTVDGGVPPARLEAVAWPRAIAAPAALLQRGGGVRALAELDGTFVLEGLPACTSVLVGASGRGWVSRQPILVESGETQEPVVVTACRVFGVVAQARDPAGRPFAPSSFVNIVYRAEDRGFQPLHSSERADWALAGLLDAIRHYEPSEHWSDAPLVFKADRIVPTARIALRYRVPGVRVADASVTAYPVDDEIVSSRIYLDTDGEVADVAVDFEPRWGDGNTQLLSRPMFEIHVCDDRDEPKWRYPLSCMGGLTLRGVPCGTHRIRLVRHGTGQAWSARHGSRAEVKRGEPNIWTFDTSGLCAARIVGPDELWSREPRSIRVGNVSCDFAGGPYLVWGLAPGEVKVVSGDYEGLAELVAGATVTVRMQKIAK
jgi:hypothetical protein